MAFTHARATARAAVVVVAVCLVVAIAAVAQEAPPAVTASDFTDAERANTLAFLRAFVAPGSELEPEWPGTDFCLWFGVECLTTRSVWLWLLNDGQPPFSGTLPGLPADVDGAAVAVTAVIANYGVHKLSGTLPASWARLTRMERLRLESNSLAGTLPVEWRGMTSLAKLRLDNNKLSGTLPSSFLPENLVVLHLNGNGFSGTFPTIWSTLAPLSVLLLHDNQLTGSIGPSRGFYTWTAASFSSNRLCGCVAEPINQSMFYSVDAAMSAPDCATANAC